MTTVADIRFLALTWDALVEEGQSEASIGSHGALCGASLLLVPRRAAAVILVVVVVVVNNA
jgi:hypothetical protein